MVQTPLRAAAALLAAALLGPAPAALADVLFDNYGPGDMYELDRGATLAYGGPLGGEQHEAAMAFTVAGGDYYLTEANVTVMHNWGPDLVHVRLHADDAGRPGAVLEATTATGVTEPFVWGPPMVASFSGTVVLEEGRQYWLALATAEEDALLAWGENSIDHVGWGAHRINGGEWTTYFEDYVSAFRIHGTPVPAPGALALLGLGPLVRRRQREA